MLDEHFLQFLSHIKGASLEKVLWVTVGPEKNVYSESIGQIIPPGSLKSISHTIQFTSKDFWLFFIWMSCIKLNVGH